MHSSEGRSRVVKLFRILVLSQVLLLCSGLAQTVSEQYLFAAANQVRREMGVRPLRLDPALTQAALLHAREMAEHRSISHQFSGESSLAVRVDRAGVRFSLVTENVAEASNSVLIHELWMKSAGHRANLLDPKVDALGVAVVAVRGQLYAVQDFVQTVPDLTISAQEDEVVKLIAGSGLEILHNPDDARETCLLSSGYAGRRQPWFVMRYTASDLSSLPEGLSAKLLSGRFRSAAVGACSSARGSPFSGYSIAVLLYP